MVYGFKLFSISHQKMVITAIAQPQSYDLFLKQPKKNVIICQQSLIFIYFLLLLQHEHEDFFKHEYTRINTNTKEYYKHE